MVTKKELRKKYAQASKDIKDIKTGGLTVPDYWTALFHARCRLARVQTQIEHAEWAELLGKCQ